MAEEPTRLSPRAREILRRADAQVEALRRSRALGPDGLTAAEAAASRARSLEGPPSPQRIMDRVQDGLAASRAHLDALADALQALADALGAAVDVTPPGARGPLVAPAEPAGVPAEWGEPVSAAEPPPAPAMPAAVPAALAGRARVPGAQATEIPVAEPLPREAIEEPAAEAPRVDDAAPSPAEPAGHDAAVEPPIASPPPPDPLAERPSRSTAAASQDAARLVAIELAVAGEPRDAVEARLRGEFGIEDPTEILDDVFGPGTPADSRIPGSDR